MMTSECFWNETGMLNLYGVHVMKCVIFSFIRK